MTKHFTEEGGSCFIGEKVYTLKELAEMEMPARTYKYEEATASILITPEHPNYEALVKYTSEGIRFTLNQGEFSVTNFEMVGNNIQIWLKEIKK